MSSTGLCMCAVLQNSTVIYSPIELDLNATEHETNIFSCLGHSSTQHQQHPLAALPPSSALIKRTVRRSSHQQLAIASSHRGGLFPCTYVSALLPILGTAITVPYHKLFAKLYSNFHALLDRWKTVYLMFTAKKKWCIQKLPSPTSCSEWEKLHDQHFGDISSIHRSTSHSFSIPHLEGHKIYQFWKNQWCHCHKYWTP